ncbi:MAG: CBS domain-containing protein [Candidatus Bathyarchaeia archaeon]
MKLMKENNIGGLPVTDEESRVRAIITERDVSNLFVGKLSEIKVSHIMTKDVTVIPPEATVLRAEKLWFRGVSGDCQSFQVTSYWAW